MKIIKKVARTLRLWWYSLMYGLKGTENTVLKQLGVSSDNTGFSISQQQESNRVSLALLRGELTQEVKELRYRTYKIDREAKQYKYYSPTLTIKKDEKLDTKFVSYENSDGYDVVTIQPNHAVGEGVLDGMREFVGDRRLTDYIIKIKRDHIARYRLETYTKRLVVRKDSEGQHYLDFYVSVYPDDKDYTTAGFISEVKRIKEKQSKPTIFDFEEVSFITSHAYRMHDMVQFVFRNIFFKGVVEFDGHYVVRFSATPKLEYDLIDKFYCKEMDEKYKRNEKKNVPLDLLGHHAHEEYQCERCGKVFVYDTDDINDIDASKPRLITEEQTEDTDSTLEYRDLQITEATFGKRLCKDCLKEYLEQSKKFDE